MDVQESRQSGPGKTMMKLSIDDNGRENRFGKLQWVCVQRGKIDKGTVYKFVTYKHVNRRAIVIPYHTYIVNIYFLDSITAQVSITEI